MFKEEYGQAAVEVLDILDNTNKKDLEKIPKSFIQFLVDNSPLDYEVNLDHSKKISEMNLNQKTQELLGYIYIKWWCDDEEKAKYVQEIRRLEQERQEKIRKKYNPDNIFDSRKNNKIDNAEEKTNVSETFEIVKYKENIFTRIINKIKSFFKR